MMSYFCSICVTIAFPWSVPWSVWSVYPGERLAASLTWLKLLSSSPAKVTSATWPLHCTDGCALVQAVVKMWSEWINVSTTLGYRSSSLLPGGNEWRWDSICSTTQVFASGNCLRVIPEVRAEPTGSLPCPFLPKCHQKTLCALCWGLWDKWS